MNYKYNNADIFGYNQNVEEMQFGEWINEMFYHCGIGLNYDTKKYFSINVAIIKIEEQSINYDVFVKLQSKRFQFLFNRSNSIFMNLFLDSNNDYSYSMMDNNIINNKFSFSINYDHLAQIISIGQIETNAFNYNYLDYSGKIVFPFLLFEYNFGHFDSSELIFKDYAKYSVTVSPKVNKRSYRPYVKLSGNYLSVNNNYTYSSLLNN